MTFNTENLNATFILFSNCLIYIKSEDGFRVCGCEKVEKLIMLFMETFI